MRAWSETCLDCGIDRCREFRGAAEAATLRADERAAALVEFALFAGLLVFGLLNMVDVSICLYRSMELDNATQMGVQVVWKTCDPTKRYLPATTSCGPNPPSYVTSIVTTAVQSTSLGTKVSLQSGSPAEGYYCVDSSGSLQLVQSDMTQAPPASCSTVGMANLRPADYIKITTQFSFAPMFPGITVARFFPTLLTKSAIMRLD